jgi:2',3'-cyclic-nucleotide 2'-phosphodiesterase (5'-nucleotidase family)
MASWAIPKDVFSLYLAHNHFYHVRAGLLMKTSIHYLRRVLFQVIITLTILTVLYSQPKTITILHTNDMHASFIPHEAFWVKENPKPLVGGLNELSFAVDSLRRIKSATLLLDAGDVMTGNPITEYVYGGAEGGALFEMMNRIGYELWTPGNHDFDISSANLRKLTNVATFPTVSANILDTLNRFPVNNKEYVVIEKNGLKIGIIGIMSDDFYNLVNQNSSAGIKILPSIETLKRLAALLRPQTDLLIALTHQGVDEDSILAMNVQGLDIIVGGHSHTRLKHPKKVNGVLIVQTGSNCENLGVLDLKVENHHVISYDGSLVQLWYNAARPKTGLSAFIDSVKMVIDQDYSKVIATLKTDWNRGHGESGIGNFIADAQREAAGADIGFMNSSGIRKDLSAGPVTKRDVFEILPFRNILVKFELTGMQIRSIVEFSLREHTGIQTSGIQCDWKKKADGGIDFETFLVNGKPLDEHKIYIGAASDYMMGEVKKYFGIETLKLTYLNQTVFAAVEKKIRETKEISSAVEYRIKNIK